MQNIHDKAYERAAKMVAKAQPGHMMIDGSLYTFVFCQREWHYQIYKDGFLLVQVKEFTLAKAKKYLQWWLAN